MIILRSKTYSDQDQVSSRDLLEEQLKLQRALMETQKKREELRSEETRARQRNSMQQTRLEAQKDEQAAKAVSKTLKRDDNSEAHLYKVASRPVQPVPMKI